MGRSGAGVCCSSSPISVPSPLKASCAPASCEVSWAEVEDAGMDGTALGKGMLVGVGDMGVGPDPVVVTEH